MASSAFRGKAKLPRILEIKKTKLSIENLGYLSEFTVLCI
jgi:hypothetical protein